MKKRPTSEERVALIVGDELGTLDHEAQAEMYLLADLLADPATWAEPNVDLEDAVMQAVADANADPVMVAHAPPVVTPLRRNRPRWLAGVAAAAAVIVGVGLLVGRDASHADFTSQLAATPLAPSTRGHATISKNAGGFRIMLDAHGLPELADHEYYEGWLADDDGSLVAVGTFSSSNGPVTLWSGVSPKEYRTLSVTIEREDSDQSSSGRRVLAGTIDDS